MLRFFKPPSYILLYVEWCCLAVGKGSHHALGRVEARMDGDVKLLYAHSSQNY